MVHVGTIPIFTYVLYYYIYDSHSAAPKHDHNHDLVVPGPLDGKHHGTTFPELLFGIFLAVMILTWGWVKTLVPSEPQNSW